MSLVGNHYRTPQKKARVPRATEAIGPVSVDFSHGALTVGCSPVRYQVRVSKDAIIPKGGAFKPIPQSTLT